MKTTYLHILHLIRSFTNNLKIIFPIIILTVLLSGCEEIINFKGPETQKKLVLNAIIGCDEEIEQTLSLSKTAFLYSNENIEEVYYADIDVKLNDELFTWEQFRPGMGYPSFKVPGLKAGDKISVRAEVEDIAPITAEDVFPKAPEIISVETIKFLDELSQSPCLRFLIKIKDDPAENNFYRLIMSRKVYQERPEWEPYEEVVHFNIDQDPAMSSLTSEGIQGEEENSSRILSDDIFQGKEYTINVYLYSYYGKEKMEYTIELQSLSRSLYLYMRTLEQCYNSDILHEPVKVYSNVKGGYGILGLYNSTKRKFTMKLDPIPENPWLNDY